MSQDAEAFLDQLITWRELGYGMCTHWPSYDRYASLPDWAGETLENHANDPRPFVYGVNEFEHARTHDPLWNAAQRTTQTGRAASQLSSYGVGEEDTRVDTVAGTHALDVMIHLNNKYALDGRNPNSYSGIFWILGRYDRPWGPERPVFGKIRYMSSENTRRKLRLKTVPSEVCGVSVPRYALSDDHE